MSQIDFYISPNPAPQSRERLACKIIEKAWSQGHKIYIHCDADSQALLVSRLLWTLHDGSFIPHDLFPEPSNSIAPIRIGYAANQYWQDATVLVNLATTVPEFYTQFARLVEVINGDEQVKQAGRLRYRHYQGNNANAEMNTHQLRG